MRSAREPLAILDTTVLVHLIRNDATGQAIEEEYALSSRAERPLLSTVAEGEMRGLAMAWRWGEKNIAALERLLDQLVRVEAGMPEIVQAYAQLYAEATVGGHPRGENDLWIAATAKVTKAQLFTCDADFDWLDPEPVSVRRIPEVQ